MDYWVTAWGGKLLWCLAVQQQILLYHTPDGSQANRLCSHLLLVVKKQTYQTLRVIINSGERIKHRARSAAGKTPQRSHLFVISLRYIPTNICGSLTSHFCAREAVQCGCRRARYWSDLSLGRWGSASEINMKQTQRVIWNEMTAESGGSKDNHLSHELPLLSFDISVQCIFSKCIQTTYISLSESVCTVPAYFWWFPS